MTSFHFSEPKRPYPVKSNSTLQGVKSLWMGLPFVWCLQCELSMLGTLCISIPFPSTESLWTGADQHREKSFSYFVSRQHFVPLFSNCFASFHSIDQTIISNVSSLWQLKPWSQICRPPTGKESSFRALLPALALLERSFIFFPWCFLYCGFIFINSSARVLWAVVVTEWVMYVE